MTQHPCISGCWDDLHPGVPLVAWSSCHVAMLLCPYLALQGGVLYIYWLHFHPVLFVFITTTTRCYGDEAHSLSSPVSEYLCDRIAWLLVQLKGGAVICDLYATMC